MRLFVIALLAVAACNSSTRPAEVVALPPAPPPGPWHVMREALDHCAHTYQLAGELQVRVELDRFGKVIAIGSGYGDGFASCVGNATMTSRYRSHAGRVLLVGFTKPSSTPPP